MRERPFALIEKAKRDIAQSLPAADRRNAGRVVDRDVFQSIERDGERAVLERLGDVCAGQPCSTDRQRTAVTSAPCCGSDVCRSAETADRRRTVLRGAK